MPDALFVIQQLLCDQQPLCNAFGALFIVAYAAAATIAILVTMAYIRKKRSDRALR